MAAALTKAELEPARAAQLSFIDWPEGERDRIRQYFTYVCMYKSVSIVLCWYISRSSSRFHRESVSSILAGTPWEERPSTCWMADMGSDREIHMHRQRGLCSLR